MGRKNRGSVYETPDGWRAQATIAGERQSLGTWPTEARAWSVLGAALEQVGDAAEGKTLRAYGETWITRRELSGLVRGIRQERSSWYRHVASSDLAAMPLHRIERRHIAAWVRELVQTEAVQTVRKKGAVEYRPTGRTISRQTAQHPLRILRACLDEAANEGYAKVNPAAGVKLPKSLPRDPAWTFLSLEEIKAIATCAKLELPTRAALVTAIYTGLRKSELLALRWERVHLDGERPRVEVRGAVKSQSAIREVPLLAPARDVLLELRDRGGVRRAKGLVWPLEPRSKKKPKPLHEEAHARGFDFGWGDHPEYRLVKIKNEANEVIATKTERIVRQGAKTIAGIARHVRFHDLRHTCASHLVIWRSGDLVM